MKRFLEQAERVIGIDSRGQKGSEEVVSYLSTYLQATGLKLNNQQVLHSVEGASKRQFNLIGILGDPLVDRTTRKGLLLCSHLDTVDVGSTEDWTENHGDPWRACRESGRIYGLGAADGKLDFLCKLQALQKFRETKLKMPVYLVGTCGEEMGMFGARYLIQSLALNPKYVLIGKPTGLKIVRAHKACTVLKIQLGYHTMERGARGFTRMVRIHCHGENAHGALPHRGKNALVGMIRFIRGCYDAGFDIRISRIEGGNAVNQVPDHAIAECFFTSHQLEDFKRYFREVARKKGSSGKFEIELGGAGNMGLSFLHESLFDALDDILSMIEQKTAFFKKKKNEDYDPPYPTMSLNRLEQGQGKTDLYVDLRYFPEDAEQRVTEFREKILEIAGQYSPLNFDVVTERTLPGLEVPMESDWVKSCGEAMDEAELMPNIDHSSLCSEAGLFNAAGFDALVFGPGSEANGIHGPNEFIALEDLGKAVKFYEKLIEKVCL